MEEFKLKQEQNIINNSEAINDTYELINSHEEFLKEIQKLLSSNENLRNGLSKYGGMGMFYDFNFISRVGANKDVVFENNENHMIEFIKSNNGWQINLKELLTSFNEKKNQILEKLSKNFLNKEEAFEEIQNIHKELILPALNENPIMGN